MGNGDAVILPEGATQRTVTDAQTGGISVDDAGQKRRRWTTAEKVAIVLESFQSRAPNIDTCRRHGISEPTLYKWRQLFVDGGEMFLEAGGRSKVAAIVAENHQLRQALAELALANRRLLGRHLARSGKQASSPIVADLFRGARAGRSLSDS